MGLLSFLYRALRGRSSVGGSVRQNVPQQSPRLMTPTQRETALAALKPEELRHGEWQTGSSSWISALKYNAVGQYGQMRVIRGGKVYTFARMAFATFRTWKDSPSWGSYFNRFLKGRYSRA